MSKDKHTKKSSYRQLFEFSLIAISIIVLVLLVTYSVQLNRGIAKEIKGPQYSLRLEILNAGVENGLEDRLSDYLKDLKIPNMELEIVKASRFTLQPSKETFIINRLKETDGVIELSKLLGIDENKIQYSELKLNKNHINATIIIGTDEVIHDLLDQTEELE